MSETPDLDQLIEQTISQVKKQRKETEKVYVVDVTVGMSVARLWTLNYRTAIVTSKNEKIEEILKVLDEGKICIVEVERDTMVMRRNIVRVVGSVELPVEKLLRVLVDPDRNGIKLVSDGTILRPDPFSYNTQRLMENYESGTTEVYVLPVSCDSRGKCFGIQWKGVEIEQYIERESPIQTTEKGEKILTEEGIKLSLRKSSEEDSH